MTKLQHKDVVVIGNGPSAITLSYLLAGNWPYYSRQQSHPNEYLHARLRSSSSSASSDSDSISKQRGPDSRQSLVEQDLEHLCNGIQGRSINPVSVLLDSLQHPEADFGVQLPSCLDWKLDANKVVDHVVLGKGSPGGAWSRMDDFMDTLTVSVGTWLQLPNMCIEQWHARNNKSSLSTRISLSIVGKYYRDYVRLQKLERFFRNDSEVSHVKFDEQQQLWHVKGWQDKCGPFEYVTPKVVLATGNSDVPNQLQVAGEELPFVFHSLNQLEQFLASINLSNLTDPVLIVGAGLSAADAVIACRSKKIPVRHVFRRHPEDAALIFNQLPENTYPEYHSVLGKMKGNNCHYGYKPFAMHTVSEIRSNKEVVLTNLIGVDDTQTTSNITIKVSYVLVLIGMKPMLHFVKPKHIRQKLAHNPQLAINPRTNPVTIQPFSHQCLATPGLYAMGAIVGDNFVRFVQGAALAITNHIWTERRDHKTGAAT